MRIIAYSTLGIRRPSQFRRYRIFKTSPHAFSPSEQSRGIVHDRARFRSTRPAAMLADSRAGGSAGLASTDYKDWTNERLIQRVLELEETLRANMSASSSITSNSKNLSRNKQESETTATGMKSRINHLNVSLSDELTAPTNGDSVVNGDSIESPLVTTSSPQPRPMSQRPRCAPARSPKPKKLLKQYDPSKWSRRHIALKFAYLGGNYNGFEHHANNKTPLPTVEEELWKALVRTRLIAPPSLAEHGLDVGDIGQALDKFGVGEVPVDWNGCRYSKCGRTDRGVSAFGQVIGVLVRSARKQRRKAPIELLQEPSTNGTTVEVTQPPSKTVFQTDEGIESQDEEEQWEVDENDGFDPINDEINYVQILNRILPPTIRMLAWCPNATANFDARFSCKEREYRYFFTQPAYLPIPGSGTTLNIEAMREAAQYLIGSHDFRNMCKIDPAKQITEFIRKVRTATVEKVDGFESPQYVANARDPTAARPKMAEAYCIRVSGTAFLWHQVRCIVGVLFLVGQGYEKPDIVKQLLDVSNCPARPAYEMADDRPLVLWDCRFSTTAGRLGPNDVLDRPLHDRGEGADELQWVYPGSASKDHSHPLGGKWNKMGVMENLWKLWRATKIDEILAAQLFDAIALPDTAIDDYAVRARQKSVQIFLGEDTSVSKGTYVPVMQKKRLADVDAANAHWLSRKGPDHHRVRRQFGQVPQSVQPLDS